MRPELLAVRAINQYRRRDILAYIGLRYYLENSTALSNRWIEDVSTHLLRTRSEPIYYKSHHFKEVDRDGSIKHRAIYVSGPNEILAETALLYQCASEAVFRSSKQVYSYQFPSAADKQGVFRSYFPGFKERHQLVRMACIDSPDSIVQYTDIRKFYPSITTELARKTWSSVCESSNLAEPYQELGHKILDDHASTSARQVDGAGILTGPMFSHLIANLILAEIDDLMFQETGGKYWRYVDDVILVGSESKIKKSRALLKLLLDDLGFELHAEGKDFKVGSSEWLEGADDFADETSTPWMALIGNLKRFLVVKSEERTQLSRIFLENGINIPLLDYSSVVKESNYLESLHDWLTRYRWAYIALGSIKLDGLVYDALAARQIYEGKLRELLDQLASKSGYSRKRLIPKIRYCAGRLTYLAMPETLDEISEIMAHYPELRLRSAIMKAVSSRDVTEVLKLGNNAVQAAAQILRIAKEPVTLSSDGFNEVDLQGIAVLQLNGIEIKNFDLGEIQTGLLNQFASGDNPLELMKSEDLFVKELACLRGVERTLQHRDFLDTAFDRDESLTFDIINQLNDSSYY